MRARRNRVEVPNAAHGLDPLGLVSRMSELFPEVADVHVHAAVVGRQPAIEDGLGKFFPCNDLTCCAQEHFQKVELDGGEFDELVGFTFSTCSRAVRHAAK